MIWAPIHLTRLGCSTPRPIGARPSSRIGATIGSRSERSAWYAHVRPWTMPGTSVRSTFPQTDNYTDIGFDTQYQYQGSNFWITLRGSYIHEYQKLNASFANGLAGNPTNTLNEARAYASLAYGNDNRVVLTGQYFTSWGSSDALYCTAAVRTPTVGSPRSPTFRSSSSPGAGMAVVQRPHRTAIHLVQRIQRHHRRRQRQ